MNKVKDAGYRGMRAAQEYYEKQGYTLFEIRGPFKATEIEHDILAIVPPDAARYTYFLRMGKEEHTLHFDIPDEAVPTLEEKGLVLAE